MGCSICKLPDQPAVYSAEEKISRGGSLASFGYVIQNPFNFAGRKISIGDKSGCFTYVVGVTILFYLFNNLSSTAALPDDGIVDRPAAVPVPHNRCFTLIGDANSCDFLCCDVRLSNYLIHNCKLRRKYFHRVLFNPGSLRIILRKLFLRAGYYLLFPVNQQGSGTCSSLVQCQNILSQICLLYVYGIFYQLYFIIPVT